MEKEFYSCQYCFKEYEPKRRRIQKYCSDKCRSKAHHARNPTKALVPIEKTENNKPSTNTIDKMSPSGVGNAAAGTLIADGVKHLFTAEQNRPVTKADFAKLESKLKRYHKIENLPPDHQGKMPYFDLETNKVTYSFFPLYN